ncbi:uncharacterized protein LOC141850557 [Brevipalpus obovatus]|uniref:uncharacterized protein LOC141850557 n=1 Tax=Brevipalpus obovatus TaxID=246614 RepID=UPI003D9DBC1B
MKTRLFLACSHASAPGGHPADADLHRRQSTMSPAVPVLTLLLVSLCWISVQCQPHVNSSAPHPCATPLPSTSDLNFSSLVQPDVLGSTARTNTSRRLGKRDIIGSSHALSEYFFHDMDEEMDSSEVNEAMRRISDYDDLRHTSEFLNDSPGLLSPANEDTHHYFLPPKSKRKSHRQVSHRNQDKLESKHSEEEEEERDPPEPVRPIEVEGQRGGRANSRRPKVPYNSATFVSSNASRSADQSSSRRRIRPLSARQASRRRSDNTRSTSPYETGLIEDEERHIPGPDDASDTLDFNTRQQQPANRRRSRGRARVRGQQDDDSTRKSTSSSDDSDPLTPNQSSDNRVNQLYRPNYQHYESRGLHSSSNFRNLNDASNVARTESTANNVFSNSRNRYFQSRPHTVGEYRTQNVFNTANRLPTILVPNQDIRQLSRPFLTTAIPEETAEPSLARFPSNPAPVSYESRYENGRSDGRRTHLYRTVVADHLIDEEEPRTATTPRPIAATEASFPIQTIPVDFHYQNEREKRPTFEYRDQSEPQYQPLTTTANPLDVGVGDSYSSRDQSNRYNFIKQSTTEPSRTQASYYGSLQGREFTATTRAPTQPREQPVEPNDEYRPPPVRPAGRPAGSRPANRSPPVRPVRVNVPQSRPNKQDNTASSTGGNDEGQPSVQPNGQPGGRRRRKRPRASTSTTTSTTSQPNYYDNEYEDDYDEDYETTSTTTKPRRKGRRRSTTTTSTPPPTTRTLSPGYKHRSDNRIIDFMADPNFPHELKGADLTDYPFYISLPSEIHFNCQGRHDGYYASIEHKCQVYHHCAQGHRYDFLCPNYTLFDQTTFTCRFVNTVDCPKSADHFNRNDELYIESTEEPDLDAKPKKEDRPKRNQSKQLKNKPTPTPSSEAKENKDPRNDSADQESGETEISREKIT